MILIDGDVPWLVGFDKAEWPWDECYIDTLGEPERSAFVEGRSLAVRITTQSPEYRAKQSVLMKALRGTPEARAKQSAISKQHRNTPEAKARQSEIMKATRARARVVSSK